MGNRGGEYNNTTRSSDENDVMIFQFHCYQFINTIKLGFEKC